jgi:peptide/nickel transport system permease protein
VTTYIVRRLFVGVLVILLVSLMIFFLMRLLPGDPLQLYVGESTRQYTPAEMDNLRAQYHLNDPLVSQYGYWLSGVVRGDLGQSVMLQRSVTSVLAQRFPVTLNLAVLALLISVILGPLFGTIAAIRRGKWQDTTVSVLANVGITLPVFWVGMMLMYIFAYKLGWLPTYGYTAPNKDFGKHVLQLIMPVFCLSIFGTASQTRQARSSMLEVAHQDYVRTAWSKGLKEKTVVLRHMLKNGLIPVVTTLGMQVGFVFGGAVAVETVFNIPGLGRMLAEGVANRDYQVVQGGALVMAVVIVLTNLLVDMAYAWLDPRTRSSYK